MQSGKTTRQMKGASRNALYIWPNANTHYAQALAKQIGRSDLQIIPASFLTIDKMAGRKFTSVILDHAVSLTDDQYEAYQYSLTRALSND